MSLHVDLFMCLLAFLNVSANNDSLVEGLVGMWGSIEYWINDFSMRTLTASHVTLKLRQFVCVSLSLYMFVLLSVTNPLNRGWKCQSNCFREYRHAEVELLSAHVKTFVYNLHILIYSLVHTNTCVLFLFSFNISAWQGKNIVFSYERLWDLFNALISIMIEMQP